MNWTKKKYTKSVLKTNSFDLNIKQTIELTSKIAKKTNLVTWKTVLFMNIIFMMCCFQTNAQQTTSFLQKKNQFKVGVGLGFYKTKDYQVSPNLYQSLSKSLQLGYSSKLKKGIFSTSFNFFLGNLKSNSGSEYKVFDSNNKFIIYAKETDINGVEKIVSKEIKFLQLGFNIDASYLHKITKLDTSKTTFYIGGGLEECMVYTPAFLFIGTINYGSLNFKTRFDYVLKNGKPIMFGLSVPFLSIVTRFPYHNAPNYPEKSGLQSFFTDNNHIETFNHFQNIRFSAKYNWLVKKRIAFDVTFEASWLHYNRPEHLTQMGSQLILGYNF